MFGLGRYGGLFGHISLVNVERVSLILVERSCDACTSVELLQVDLFPLANLLRELQHVGQVKEGSGDSGD